MGPFFLSDILSHNRLSDVSSCFVSLSFVAPPFLVRHKVRLLGFLFKLSEALKATDKPFSSIHLLISDKYINCLDKINVSPPLLVWMIVGKLNLKVLMKKRIVSAGAITAENDSFFQIFWFTDLLVAL